MIAKRPIGIFLSNIWQWCNIEKMIVCYDCLMGNAHYLIDLTSIELTDWNGWQIKEI